jgi:hypothetical protein
MKSSPQMLRRLSIAIVLTTAFSMFAASGASARIVDDYFRDAPKVAPSTGGQIVDPAVRNRLVDDSFRDTAKAALRTSGAIIDSPVRNRLVDDSFRDPANVALATGHSGFGWGDAGIGAAVGLGLVLFAGGAVIAARKRRTLAHVS